MKVLLTICLLFVIITSHAQDIKSDSINIMHTVNKGNRIEQIIIKRRYKSTHQLNKYNIYYYYLDDLNFNNLKAFIISNDQDSVSKDPLNIELPAYRVVLNSEGKKMSWEIHSEQEAKEYFNRLFKIFGDVTNDEIVNLKKELVGD